METRLSNMFLLGHRFSSNSTCIHVLLAAHQRLRFLKFQYKLEKGSSFDASAESSNLGGELARIMYPAPGATHCYVDAIALMWSVELCRVDWRALIQSDACPARMGGPLCLELCAFAMCHNACSYYRRVQHILRQLPVALIWFAYRPPGTPCRRRQGLGPRKCRTIPWVGGGGEQRGRMVEVDA